MLFYELFFRLDIKHKYIYICVFLCECLSVSISIYFPDFLSLKRTQKDPFYNLSYRLYICTVKLKNGPRFGSLTLKIGPNLKLKLVQVFHCFPILKCFLAC